MKLVRQSSSFSGAVSARERRDADLFWNDLWGQTPRRALRGDASLAAMVTTRFGQVAASEMDEAAGDEPVPRAVAPHILDFRATDIMANDPLAFRTSLRGKAIEMMGKFVDLGIRNTPAGRQAAYIDAIAWNESATYREGLKTCPLNADGACIASSCALVVRSLWRLLGARGALAVPYVSGSAMQVLQQFARSCGALQDIRSRADFDRANVRAGDVVFINRGTSQHVFTVIERTGSTFKSIDGGQGGDNDGMCCGIKRRTRVLSAGLTFVGDERPITAVVNLDKLRFTAKMIDLVRNTPPSPATEDEPEPEAESSSCNCHSVASTAPSESYEATPPSLDDIVVALDRIAGTSLRTYAAYRATLVNGTVFGQAVTGLHPTFLRKLELAQADAQQRIGGTAPVNWGISSIGGHSLRPPRNGGWHPWGLAIDMNYASSPFIMHEAGEAALDAQLAPVYHRIARFVLGRTESVIPRTITQGAISTQRTATLYTQLAAESNAMIAYFRFLTAPAELDERLRQRPMDADAARAFFGDATPATPINVLRCIMRDYVLLSGRPGPAVPNETYPQIPAVAGADRPFAGASAARDPLRGFLSIRPEIALALSAQGLRWGAIDFGSQSGDVMHFDDGNGPLASQIARAKRAAAT